MLLGAQDVYFEKNGAFTGEISLDDAQGRRRQVRASTGHSERRHVLQESPELVGKKAAAIYAAG